MLSGIGGDALRIDVSSQSIGVDTLKYQCLLFSVSNLLFRVSASLSQVSRPHIKVSS